MPTSLPSHRFKNTFSALLLSAGLCSMLALAAGCSNSTTPSSTAPSQGVLTGTIVDSTTRAGLPNVTITLAPSGKTKKTDANGNFEMDSVPTGASLLTATLTGYHPLTDSVKIVKDSLTTFDHALLVIIPPHIVGWTSVNSPVSVTLDAVCALSPSTFYAVGFNGTIISSNDSGKSWTSLSSPTTANLYGVHFSDANHGTIAGNNGALYYTSNGGTTWNNLITTIYSFRNFCFSDPMTGTAVGGDGLGGVGIVMRTTNGGASWNDISSSLPANTFGFYGVGFFSASIGFITGANGEIYSTTSGGSGWTQLNIGTGSGTLFGVSMPDAMNIAIVGDGGAIYHSTNGGKNWATQQSNVSGRLSSVVFSDDLHGVIAGYSSVVLVTTDGGNTWTSVPAGTADYAGCAMTDPLHGVIVGTFGSILVPVVQ